MLAPRVLSLASGENPGTKDWIWQDKRARTDDESVDKVITPQNIFFSFTKSFDGGCASPDFVDTDNFYYPTSYLNLPFSEKCMKTKFDFKYFSFFMNY